MAISAVFALVLTALPVWALSSGYTDGDVIVVLRPSEKNSSGSFSASELSIEASDFAASVSGASVSAFYPSLSESEGGAFMMIHSDSMDAEEFAEILRADPNVIAVSPNYKVHAAVVPNDNYYDECWGMEEIKAPSAWDTTTGKDTIYAAIIDSGIDYTNPDLTDNVAVDLSYRTLKTGNTDDAFDDYGHGTHVAGTIGAKGNNTIGVAGLNWNCRMIPVKALDSSGNGDLNTVIKAVDYVTGLINQGVNIRAVNLSLETYMALEPTHDNLVSSALWRAFKALDNTNKAVIVVAAGNYGETVGEPTTKAQGKLIPGAGYYVYPASFKGLDNMISVGALARIPYLGTTYLATFSNKGANIQAPGQAILSTWLQSATGNVKDDGVSLRSAQGTSMAAPHVAGAAMLVASVLPEAATAYQIRQALLFSSELDVAGALSYASSNYSSLAARGTEGRSYDDYNSYSEEDYIETGSGKTGSSGGCEGLTLGIFGLAAVFMLAIKKISC